MISMDKKNILIAQVGRGTYTKTAYLYGDDFEELFEKGDEANLETSVNEQAYKTEYTFEATYRVIRDRFNNEMDKIILIGTEQSSWDNLYNNYFEKCSEDIKNKIEAIISLPENTPDNKRISMAISGYLKGKLDENFVEVCIIRNGISDKELQDNFSKLKKQFENIIINYTSDQKYRVYFDITNGFRSLPMYIYNLGNYMLTVWNTKVEVHMYYGMFEANKPINENNKVTPIVNLEDVNDLMRWINAANEFNNYGAVREIVKILGSEQNESWNQLIGHMLSDNKTTLSGIFEKFDYASNANNLYMLRETVTYIMRITEVIDDTKFAVPEYAKVLLKSISKRFYDMFNQENKNLKLISDNYIFNNYTPEYSYSYLTIMLAKYYLQQDRVGHSAIALQEGVTTYIMERWPYLTREIIFKSNSKNEKLDVDHLDESSWDEWLFDYKARVKIANWFKFLPVNFDTFDAVNSCNFNIESLSFIYKMNIVREVIRNQEAHILARDIDDTQIANSKTVLESLINEMEGYVSSIICDDCDDESIFYDAYGLFRDLLSQGENIQESIQESIIPHNDNINSIMDLLREKRVLKKHKNKTSDDEKVQSYKMSLPSMEKLIAILNLWETDKDFKNSDSDIIWLLNVGYRKFNKNITNNDNGLCNRIFEELGIL